MARCGIECTGRGRTPDHICVLFEFMARVVQAEIDAASEGDDVARQASRKLQRDLVRVYRWRCDAAEVRPARPPRGYEPLAEAGGCVTVAV
jgi:hypothetical protein